MDYFLQIAPVVAVLGGTTYVVGLVALWAPIAWSYTHDFDTAWHAVSLVSKTTVAGQGVRLLLGPALLWTVIGTAFLVYIQYTVLSEFGETRLPWSAVSRAIRPLIMVSVAILVLVLVVSYVYYFYENPDLLTIYADRGISGLLANREGGEAIVSLGNLVIGLVSWYLYWRLLMLRKRKGAESLWKAVRLREVVSILFIMVLLSTLAKITLTTEPPLPTAKITGSSETEGKLLAHTEGFWYVFENEGAIIAIPDDEVKTVRISPQNKR